MFNPAPSPFLPLSLSPLLAMAIDPWILAFSLITVVATIWVGFWSARKSKTASDFFVAGRSVSVGWNASAISGEYLSAASFMGVAGMVMSSGYDALWYPVCYACGYLFLLLFIAGPLRRFGAYTIPDFAEGRFDSPLFRKIAVVFVLFIGFFYTMPQMKGAGTTLAYVFQDLDFRGTAFTFLAAHNDKGEALRGLNYSVGVLVVGAVITLNVALGGMKGITLVQAFQYWAKMFAISVPVFVLMAAYGHYGTQLQLNGTRGGAPTVERPPEFRPLANPGRPGPRAGASFAETVSWAAGQAGELRTNRPAPGTLLSAGSLRFVSAEADKLLEVYQSLIGRTLLFPSDALPSFKVTMEWTNALPMEEAVRRLESKLSQQHLAAVAYGEDLMVLCPLGQASEVQRFLQNAELGGIVRRPLPAKAPGDDLWLSPFGPLTTKAAKAANLSPEQAKPYSLLYTYSLIIALVCGTAGLPHILVRFYTNPDGGAAKRTTMWVMILIGVFYLFPPVFGVLGRNWLPELYSGSGAKGTDKIVLELPRLLNERWSGVGSIMSGITCAGAFAAFMSTFSGLLVSMTGALAHDVYGRMLRPKSTAQERLRAFKFCAVLIGAVAIVLGMQVEPLQINFMVGQAFAIAAASYFPLLFMSAWWRGMTMRGAATGMLSGGLLALAGISLTSFSDLAAAGGPTGKLFAMFKPLNEVWAAHPLWRILCEQPAIWTVPLAIGLMAVVSKWSRAEIPSDIRMKMLVLHAPEKLGLKQEYIQEHQPGH